MEPPAHLLDILRTPSPLDLPLWNGDRFLSSNAYQNLCSGRSRLRYLPADRYAILPVPDTGELYEAFDDLFERECKRIKRPYGQGAIYVTSPVPGGQYRIDYAIPQNSWQTMYLQRARYVCYSAWRGDWGICRPEPGILVLNKPLELIEVKQHYPQAPY